MSRLLIGMIRLYQRSSRWRLPVCRFTPTCSHYAIQAIECHGPLRGSAMAFWRICRCQPFSRGGHDPVPVSSGVTERRVIRSRFL